MNNDILPDRGRSDEYGARAWAARDIESDEPVIHYCKHRKTEAHDYNALTAGCTGMIREQRRCPGPMR